MHTMRSTTGRSQCCEYFLNLQSGYSGLSLCLSDDDDYDIDFYTADPIAQEGDSIAPKPSPREQLEFLVSIR